MSEYQRVIFRAIDKPVSEKNLEFMHRQSSRAEITQWSFDNEYNFGDFHGDALEMLRRGYDIHLHYADFGIRKLLIRLPNGLPDKNAAKPYLSKDTLQYIADKKGPGGILCVQPYHEPGDLDHLFDIDELVDRLESLPAEIFASDLRPLYLAQLVMARDGEHDPDETLEGPVPAGMNELSDAQRALAELYDISEAFLSAVAASSPKLEKSEDIQSRYVAWIKSQQPSKKDEWLAQLMADTDSTVRAELLAAFRKKVQSPTWLVMQRGRTISELEAAAEKRQNAADERSAQAAAKKKAKRLASIAADPAQILQETEKLVKNRSMASYTKIGQLLLELREAMANTSQSDLAENQAKKLRAEYPSYQRLISELRQAGLLPKRGK